MDNDYLRAVYGAIATSIFAALFVALPRLIYWSGWLLGRLLRAAKEASRRAANGGR